MKVTPDNIVIRHEKHPLGTAQLIEYYANMKVVEHINRLASYSSISHIPTSGTVIIVSDYDIWKNFKGHSPFAGLDVNTIEDYSKQLED